MFRPPYRWWRRLAATTLALLTIFAVSAQGHGPTDMQIERLTARIEADPGDAALYFRRGELHRIHGDDAAALSDYHRALKLKPPCHAADLGLARVLLDQRRADAALIAVDRFLSRTPSNPNALSLRGQTLAALGRIDEALRALDNAIVLHPDPSLYIERAILVASMDDSDTERDVDSAPINRAIDGLDAGIKKLGPVVTLQLCAVDMEVKRAHYDAALARLDRLAGQYARREQLLLRRGEVLDTAGRHMEAQVAYTDALESLMHLPATTRNTPASRRLEAQLRGKLSAPFDTEAQP